MRIELKDVLHLYLGCECVRTDTNKSMRLVSVYEYGENWHPDDKCVRFESAEWKWSAVQQWVKPVLRKLNSMTWDEAKEYFNKPEAELIKVERKKNAAIFDYRWVSDKVNNDDGYSYSGIAISDNELLTPQQVAWLLSRGFDLFGLIETGQAIDATKEKATA